MSCYNEPRCLHIPVWFNSLWPNDSMDNSNKFQWYLSENAVISISKNVWQCIPYMYKEKNPWQKTLIQFPAHFGHIPVGQIEQTLSMTLSGAKREIEFDNPLIWVTWSQGLISREIPTRGSLRHHSLFHTLSYHILSNLFSNNWLLYYVVDAEISTGSVAAFPGLQSFSGSHQRLQLGGAATWWPVNGSDEDLNPDVSQEHW